MDGYRKIGSIPVFLTVIFQGTARLPDRPHWTLATPSFLFPRLFVNLQGAIYSYYKGVSTRETLSLVRPKSDLLATDSNFSRSKFEYYTNNKGADQNVQMRKLVCAVVVRTQHNQVLYYIIFAAS